MGLSPGATGPRRRGPVAERRMGTPRVVFNSPFLDHGLCLLQRIKDLSIQTFVPQLPVEALAVPVLPWTSRFDIQCRCSHMPQPLPQFLGHELRTVVRANV